MRGGLTLLWALVAAIVLFAAGVFGFLLVTDRVPLFSDPAPVVTPVATPDAVVDTTYSVLVLNATTDESLSEQATQAIVAAGWPAESVFASVAGVQDFEQTTVYYSAEADAAAAEGLANAVGAGRVAQSDQYQPTDETVKQLTLVIGADFGAPAQDDGADETAD